MTFDDRTSSRSAHSVGSKHRDASTPSSTGWANCEVLLRRGRYPQIRSTVNPLLRGDNPPFRSTWILAVQPYLSESSVEARDNPISRILSSRMSRLRLTLAGIGLLLVLFLIWVVAASRNPVVPNEYQHINLGMTMPEVDAILLPGSFRLPSGPAILGVAKRSTTDARVLCVIDGQHPVEPAISNRDLARYRMVDGGFIRHEQSGCGEVLSAD